MNSSVSSVWLYLCILSYELPRPQRHARLLRYYRTRHGTRSTRVAMVRAVAEGRGGEGWYLVGRGGGGCPKVNRLPGLNSRQPCAVVVGPPLPHAHTDSRTRLTRVTESEPASHGGHRASQQSHQVPGEFLSRLRLQPSVKCMRRAVGAASGVASLLPLDSDQARLVVAKFTHRSVSFGCS